ncbi:carboxy-lyase [Nitzschia inconspicua]|uniref:Carboxy-lyase n=1 Tax=Nitzschia inconspicua TaxID=303405 RepID=A0A9K3L6T3_9STRA|nr:carboxy-lyase [Nitzschia inconspicua]
MKVPKAALLAVLGVSCTNAFVPATKPFSLNTRATPTAFHRSTSLTSTTVKDEELFRELDRNGALASEIAEIMNATPSVASRKPTKSREVLEAEAEIQTRTNIKKMMKRYEGLSGAAIVYLKLLEQGVEVVNGYSGGAVLPLLDQFHPDNPRHKEIGKEPIRWITNSNESSAGHIAEGYAKSYPINGEHKPVGVAIATSGPGVTNLITPLQDGICDGVPMVILCGQAATTAPSDAFQSAPAVAMTEPCTKWSYQIKSAAELPFVMDYAFFVATNGRPGPVFVDLPKDLQNQVLTSNMIDSYVDTKIPSNQADDAMGMASLHTEVRADTGEVFKAIRLGYESNGLSFEVAQNGESYKLEPVALARDMFTADHHATNRIYWTTNALTGEPEPITKEGNLDLNDRVTTDMLNFIKRAKKPVIIAGQGCNDCAEDLMKFAETLQIPVTTTLHALGCFDERHELALNMMGMHGHPTPNFMVQEADLIINVGSRFDDRITGRMPDFVPGARKAAELGVGGIIHVDVRLSEKAKQIEPHFFVHSTGKNFLKTMNEGLAKDMNLVPETAAWLQRKFDLEKEFPITIPRFPTETITRVDENGVEHTATRTMMSAQLVISEMDRQLLAAGKMDDAIFTTGVGIHQMVAAQLITWTQPRQMLSSGSLGTMGVSLGYCIGAKLANGKKLCISVDGDGSFNMTFTELKTVAEQNIPIKILLLDNESQMMVEYWQRLFHNGRYLAVRNQNPDYQTLAKAFGIRSIYCDSEDEIEEKMREFLFDHPDEPVLFHCRIRRTPCLPLVAPGQPLDDMILEDIDVDVDQSAAPS